MLRTLLIFLLSLILAIGVTVVAYEDEVNTMIAIGQQKFDELINGEKPEPEEPGEQIKAELESIELDTTAAKVEFAFGEKFSTDGLKVIATYKDGSKKEIPVDDCRINKPDTSMPGTRVVTVIYEGFSARYNVTVNLKVIPPISETPLANITEDNSSHRIEAELIDMVTPGAALANGAESFVGVAPEGSDATSGNKYLTGYGVAWNYFGFTFTTAERYDDVTLVLRVANSTENDLDAGAVKMFLNFTQDENGVEGGNIPLDGYIISKGNCQWTEIVIRNLTIPQGTNTLTFEVQGKNAAFDIDYIDLYVGRPYVQSIVEITDTTTIVKDLETLDTEKAFTRTDVANAHGLKPGQLFVEKVSKESEGKTTNGGTSVGAIGKGSQISTYIYVAEDSTVSIRFKAASTGHGDYFVKNNWKFYVDGVQLSTVEEVNINGGNQATGEWWDWMYTNIGNINLPAGHHLFTIVVNGTDCNVDTVEFEALSIGSFHESGKDLDDMDAPEAPAIPTINVSNTGSFTVEAEAMDQTNLLPADGHQSVMIENPENTSGGASIGACGGGYTTIKIKLEDKATVQIYGVLSHLHGGEAASYMTASLGDIVLPLAGNLNEKRNDRDYWNWTKVPFGGALELEAGEYTLTVNFVKNPNFDCVIVDVLSYGQREPIAIVEAETFDNEGVITRQDMINAGRLEAGQYGTEIGNGATCIMGYTSGTYFKFTFTAEKTEYIEMVLVGATDSGGYDVSEKLSLTINGQPIDIPSGLLTGTGATPYWDWQTVSLGKMQLVEGDNEVVLTIVSGHPNLDKVIFYPADDCAHENKTEPVQQNRVEATCSKEGSYEDVVFCSDCGAEISRTPVTIDKLAHTEQTLAAKDATCLETGLTEGKKCSVCDEIIVAQQTVDATGHNYGTAWEKNENGHWHVCLNGCGIIGNESAHNPNMDAPTEDDPQICSDCGYVIAAATGHIKHTYTVLQYNEEGHWYKCIGCELTDGHADHSFTGYVSNNNATCTADGTETGKCEVCDQKNTRTEAGSKLPHSFTSYVSCGDATCQADGNETAKCDNCDATDTRIAVGSKLAHTEETVPGYAATSGTEGRTDGKRCTSCGTVTVDQNVIPVLTVTVNAKGEYIFEAEHLDFTNLKPSAGWESRGVQIETVNQAYPPTSGGKSVGACGGGYTTLTFTLEEKATVQLYARIAHANGGAASKYMSLSLGDTGLSVSAVLNGADGNSQYFNWNDVQYGGSLNLEAGTYVITVTYKSNPNFDCIKINALSYGEFKCFDNCKYCGNCANNECKEAEHATKCECPTVNAEITLNDKVVTVEAESLDNSGVVTRQDMVNAGRLQAGQYGVETANHATAIWGFTSGTTFTINVYAITDMDVDMLIVGATDAGGYDVATKFGLTVNNVDFAIRSGSLTGVQQNADVPSYHDWRIVNMGRISLKKGINEIVLTIKEGHPNLDCIKFASTTIADVNVAKEGTTKMVINNTFDFSRSTIHVRQDVLNATKVIGKLTGNAAQTWAPADGSTFRIYVNVQEACKLQICPTSAAGATEDQLKAQSYFFNGVAMDYNGIVEVSAPGVYVYEFTCVIGANYSGVNFTVVK